LKIDLANIAGTPGARGRYSISVEVAPTEDFLTLEPVVGELEVENTGALLLVRGRLQANVGLTCVRCLGPCECPLQIDVAEEFSTEETEPDISTMDRDEPETSAMDKFVLDVSEFVRQQIVVNLPMAQICSSDCKGVCPQCGQNLNEGPCGCGIEPIDHRWGKLAELLERPDRKGDDID